MDGRLPGWSGNRKLAFVPDEELVNGLIRFNLMQVLVKSEFLVSLSAVAQDNYMY